MSLPTVMKKQYKALRNDRSGEDMHGIRIHMNRKVDYRNEAELQSTYLQVSEQLKSLWRRRLPKDIEEDYL